MPLQAPDFTLPDQDGNTRSLAEFLGNWLVLYFYPSDNSLNCTKEACNFRDEYRIISQFGNAKIVGINKGSIDSHKAFSGRHHLNFPILSDQKHKVASDYGAWRSGPVKFYDRPFGTRRNTYLINPAGQIVKTYTKVDPNNHAEEVIADLQAFQSAEQTTAQTK